MKISDPGFEVLDISVFLFVDGKGDNGDGEGNTNYGEINHVPNLGKIFFEAITKVGFKNLQIRFDGLKG